MHLQEAWHTHFGSAQHKMRWAAARKPLVATSGDNPPTSQLSGATGRAGSEFALSSQRLRTAFGPLLEGAANGREEIERKGTFGQPPRGLDNLSMIDLHARTFRNIESVDLGVLPFPLPFVVLVEYELELVGRRGDAHFFEQLASSGLARGLAPANLSAGKDEVRDVPVTGEKYFATIPHPPTCALLRGLPTLPLAP